MQEGEIKRPVTAPREAAYRAISALARNEKRLFYIRNHIAQDKCRVIFGGAAVSVWHHNVEWRDGAVCSERVCFWTNVQIGPLRVIGVYPMEEVEDGINARGFGDVTWRQVNRQRRATSECRAVEIGYAQTSLPLAARLDSRHADRRF